MKYSNTIEYNISTKLDSSGLTELQSQIKQLENSMQQLANKEFLNSDKVQNARSQLEGLNTALTNSFNSSLGILDLSKFRAELDSSGVSAQELQSIFNMMGAEGQTALNGLTSQIANFNGGIERTSSQIDKIFTTFSNTFRWGLVSSFFSQFMNAIHSSVDYVKELDDSLTQIMLVTDYNRDSMNEFARSANEAAKAVSMTTTGMTNASLIFAQQGYDLGQSQELATLSAKVANASQQDTATTSDQITAYMNAYGLENSIGELTQAMDNWALIANISAADVGELAQASQRAASMANAVGVSGEQLASQIATIESVTREAPEQIGNGLKTLYARFSDIASGKEDEDGFTLGKVTSELNKIGVQVLDEMGQIRDVGDIMEDLMVIWDDLDQTSKVAASQALAGKYQVNRFMALMDNSDMYEEYKGATGANAAGTLDIMSEEYAQSIEGRSAKLQASLEGLFSTIFNTDDIYPWMDAAQGAVDLLQQFFDALGGGKTVLLGITTLLTQAFSQNIARSINDTIANRNLGKIRENNINSVGDTLDKVGIDKTQGIGAYIAATAQQSKLGALSDAQYDAYMNNVKNWADASTALAQSEEQLTDTINLTNAVFEKISPGTAAVTKGEFGALNTIEAKQVSLTDDAVKQNLHQVDFSEESENARQVALALRDVQTETNKTEVSQKDLGVAIDFVQDRLDDLGKTYNQDQSQELRNNLEKIKENINQTGKISESAKKQIQQYITEMEHLSKNLANLDETDAKKIIADRGNAAEKAFTTKQFNQTQVDRAEENALTGQQGIDKQLDIKDILDTLNAVQQLSFAWQAFQNLGSIWTNEDLSKGEKVLQTIMNLTAGISQVIVAIDNLKNVPKMLDQIQQGYQQWIQKIIDAKNAEIAQQNAERQAAETEYYKAKGSLEAAQAKQQEAQQRVDNAKATNEEAKQEAELAESSLASAVANESVARSRLARAQAYRAEATAKRELLMLEAIENNDEAKLNTLEKQAKIFDSINADKVAKAEAQLAKAEQEVADATARVNLANEKVNKSNKEVLEAQKQLTESKNQTVQAQQRLSQAYTVFSTLQSKQTQDFIDTISNTEKLTKVLDQMKEKLLGVGSSIKNIGSNIIQFFTSPLGLAVGALGVVAGVAYGMFKDIEDKKAENSKNYEEAKAQLEQIQSLTDQANNFQQKYESQKGTDQAFNGLADSAKEYAQSLKDLGEEDKAYQVESAILRAELQNTKEAYQNLSDVVKETQEVLSDSTYIDMMDKAYGAISNTGESVQFLAEQTQELKDKKAELNNLAKDDPYRAELEAEIAELEEFISKNQEAFEAKGQLMSAALDYNLNQASKTNGWQFGILNTPGDEDLRSATLDWQSLNSILEESVPGFAQITDENERLALALTHTSDEAQRAAIQIQQMLNESDNLTDDQKIGITRQLEQSDLSAEQSAQVVAALNIDKESTYNNIVPELQDILKQVSEGENLEVVLKAKLSPEELEEAIKSQIAAYEPKDEDVSKEAFDSLADTFYENQDQMGVEGSPFEDYSEDLFGNAEALEDVVEGILRYNDAIESLDENYDDWKDALENTNELSNEHLVAVDELQETYSDFLGLSKKVSRTFASNAENLELMQEAAEGDTQAFEDLEDAAAADIYMQISGIEDLDAAQQKIEEINDILANSGIEEIPVGEIFNLDDFEGVRSAIDSELQALGLNAEQAAQYVSDVWHLDIPADQFTVIDDDMNAAATSAENTATHVAGVVERVTDTVLDNANYSVSTDIDSDTAEATDTVTFTNLTPQPIGPVPIVSMMPVGNGNTGVGSGVHMEPFVAETYGVGYTPQTHTTEQLKQRTGFKEDVKAEKGGNGGHVSLPSGSGAQGSRRPSGGSGRSSASRPSSGGRGGGGKGSCFVAGTPISMLGYYKNIEEIQVDDIVLSYNEQTKKPEFSQVIQTMIHDVIEPIYTLYIKNEQLKVTGIHRFLIIDNIINPNPQWICAENLRVGQWVLFADGTWHVIHKIEVSIEHQTVYNFEVSHNHNYYVGRNQILAHNKGGGGKKGGSGSGSKAKTIEQKEKKEHKKDYYEEVNNQLEKTDKILSKIQKEQDRLMGDKAIANQNKQIKLLQKEIALNKDKLDIQKQELADVNALIKKNDERAEQAAKAQGIAASVPEIQLDEDGIVSNYEQISAKIDEIHNQLIDKYNAAAERSDEELTKEIAKSIEKFDEYGENLLKDIQRHNKLQSEIEETNNTLEELDDTIEDIRIDAYKAYQEAQDNFKELKENAAEMAAIFQDFNEEGFLTKWSLDDTPIGDMTKAMYELDNIYNVSKEDANDFYDSIIAQKEKEKQKATDPDEKAAIQSSIDFFEGQKANLTSDTLMNGVVGRAIHDVQQLQGWIDGTNTEPNPFGENTAALRETYEEAYKRATDTYKDWRETVQDLRDAVIDAYDEQEDALERNLDEYDRIIDHLERINDTYTLYYGEDSYDGVLQIMDRQGATMQQHLNDLTDAFIYWQKKYQEALENGDEKLIQSIREKMEDAEDAMYDKAEEIAEHWVERYEKAVDASIQKIDIKLWGGGPGQMDLEDQSTIWELQKDYMDTYKDDVEKAYEVDKLRSKYINLLNDAQGMSLQTQNKIRAQMQEQLALLDGQKTVSEYDVKLANAKLEILQKQIALEDAQRNKNKMQLRRDTQGNYRYVYTADQGDVQQAQDELNESQFDAYEMTKEQTIANNDRAINLYQDYMNKMRDIANKYKDDEVARNAAMKALSEEYGKLLEALEEDFKDTTNGMYEVLMWMIDKGTQDTSTAAMDMLDQLYDKNGEVKENTGNAWRDLATQITKDVLPNINEAVAQGFADINAQASTLKEQMTGDNGVLTKIGSSTDTLKDSIDKAKEATTQWAIETENLFNAFSADNPKVQEAMKQLQAMEAQLKANEQATSALATKYREANDLLTAKTAEAANYKRALENPNEYEYKDGKVVKKEPPKTSNNGGNNSGAKSFSNGSIVGFRGSYSENSWGEGRWGNMYSGRANAVRISSFSRRSGYGPRNVHLETLGGGHLGWVTQSQLFDTGGYTGKWNSNEGMPNSKNGKLAVLHQKELVLNERDTENILTAVSMIRQISTSMQGALSNISAAASNNVSSNYNPITEQRVEIQASFPNATDADDIRQALIGLSDRAYQYAHRVI